MRWIVRPICTVASAARATGSCSSSRTCTGQERVPRHIEDSEGLIAPHGGELPEELIKSFSALKVIEESLNWDSDSDEHRSPPEDLRVAVNNCPKSDSNSLVPSVKRAE